MQREIQVLEGFANGSSYAEIARDLVLAHASVKNYAASAIKKLGARSQAHAVYLAVQQGYLDPKRRHGDHAGYAAHVYRKEEPCDACKRGESVYRAERREARKVAAGAAA